MRRLAPWLVSGLCLLGCGRSLVFPQPLAPCVFDRDCSAGLRCVNQVCRVLAGNDAGQGSWLERFGEPCDGGATCESGLCVGGPLGAFCSQRCDAGCPLAYGCKQVPDAGPACAVPEPLLCQTCASDLECGASGADQCVLLGDAHFCGRDCTFDACPPLYACTGFDGGARQCVPQGRTCDCTAQTQGLAKSCSARNEAGVCLGAQVCGPDGGFSACTAPQPSSEVCDGLDDDCSGRVDDLVPTVCTRSNAAGTCVGLLVCGDGGTVCGAPVPAFERCNFKDDNCDSRVDEGFRDDAGLYVLPQHCGGCGNDCALLLAHATSTQCAVTAGLPGCRATACEAGYFVQAAGTCAELADSLCRQCVSDSDCLGPGSRCLDVQGEKLCGRDCALGSQFPGCPAGYACTAVDAGGGAQCVPSAGTCLCTLPRVGTMRGCSFSSCRGYQQCLNGAGGLAWSTCDVASYNTEICDGIDDNCDGLTDEGFRNPVTGRYDQAQSCGFCNNDCTRIWSLALQHSQGVCDGSGPLPVCRMGPCATEVQGGVTYEWVDVNGQPEDGCECRRVFGAALTDPPDRAPGATPQTSYLDQNCDGIDGVIGEALFVSGKAAPLGNGTLASPFQRISDALGALPTSGKRYVLVAEGAYRENLLLFTGAQLFGGYSVDFRARNPQVYRSVIVGQAPAISASGPLAAVHCENIASTAVDTVLAGFTVQGYDVPGDAPDDVAGAPSYAVYLRDCGSGVVVSDNEINAGRGGAGGRGSTGAQGLGRQSSLALDGTGGASSGRITSGVCPAGFFRDGGSGGVNAQCPGATAVRGGSSVCPYVEFDAGTPAGNEQEYVARDGGLNGLGGFDWAFRSFGGSACSSVSTFGHDHDGHDGLAGGDGTPGAGGVGAPLIARHGSVAAGRWVASSLGASAGGLGSNGVPGGGGGAGGGTVRAPGAACTAWEWGATGGGGGGGACSGSGGNPGRAGGGSFAIFITASTFAGAAQAPRASGNRIARSFGGEGGNGGFGGAGGLGGRGGSGGPATSWSNSAGGKGGEGGTGATGGGGGGGAGGPAFGVFGFNVDVVPWGAQNQFLTLAGANTAGVGGAGGSSAGPGSTGGAGAGGAFGDLVSLQTCAPSCPLGTSCDSNGVCLP